MGAIEARLDVALIKEASRKAPSTPTPATPPAVSDEDVEWAAESLADPDALQWLPKGTQIALTTTEDGLRAVSVQLYPLQPMAVSAALEARLITTRGRLNRPVWERAVAALDGKLKAVVLPPDPGSIPDGKRLRWSF
jgi:hypothetical protein